MSTLSAVGAALETQLEAVTPPIATAYENRSFVPTLGTPYQRPFLLPATPNNIEIGPGYTEQGIYQVNLHFPKNGGAGPAIAQAEKIRAAFPFASSFLNAGVTVNITGTPEIGPARPDDDTFMVPVKIRWQARVAA
jgi:hypothetical protein